MAIKTALLLLLASLSIAGSQAAEQVCTPADIVCITPENDGVPGCPTMGSHHTVGLDVDVWAALAGADATVGHHCSFGIVFYTEDEASAEARIDGVGYAGASFERTQIGGSGPCTISYWVEVMDDFTGGNSISC